MRLPSTPPFSWSAGLSRDGQSPERMQRRSGRGPRAAKGEAERSRAHDSRGFALDLRALPRGGQAGGWRRLPKRLGAVTVGYNFH